MYPPVLLRTQPLSFHVPFCHVGGAGVGRSLDALDAVMALRRMHYKALLKICGDKMFRLRVGVVKPSVVRSFTGFVARRRRESSAKRTWPMSCMFCRV